MFKMIVEISLITTVSELFLSGSSFKKYIRSAMGIFLLLIIIENIFLVKPVIMENTFLEEATRLSEGILSKASKEIIDTYEENIEKTLLNNGVEVSDVKVTCDSNLTILKVKIVVPNNLHKETIKTVLTKQGIDDSLIFIAQQKGE